MLLGSEMKSLKNLKIKTKLVAIILSTTLIVLAVAFSGFAIYYRITLTNTFFNDASAIADVTAGSFVGVLLFGQPEEGGRQLEKAMQKFPNVKNAIAFNNNDGIFARYTEPESTEVTPATIVKKRDFQMKDNFLHVFVPIQEAGKNYGTLYLRISRKEMDERIQALLLPMLVIILLIVPLTLILATKLQSIISAPILHLGHVAQKVSDEGNYSLRVEKNNNDEVGMLYDSFNDMMDQIHNRDIQRDMVEKNLKATEYFLTGIMDSMPSILITINPEGTVTHWNNSAISLTGIEAFEARGKIFWEILPGFSRYKETTEKLLQTKETRQFYKELIKIKGKTFYLNVTIFPLVDIKTARFAFMINNVTDIEIKEQQLRQSQKMETVGTLAGGLAHDFNNVLGGIIGTISLYKYKTAKRKEVSQNEVEKYFTTIEESANRASDMVQHLLSITRKQEFSFAPTDLNMVIKSTVKICKNTFDKSIEIKANFSNEKPMIYADSTQIEQSLLNFSINAAHAMTIMREEGDQFGGNLNISLEKVTADKYFYKLHPEADQKEQYWKISVQDTGIGMNPQTLPKIFDPFFTTKEEGKGTGLGLAMTYNIIKHHRGFIDVYSQEGIGTTFHIYLPILRSQETEAVSENEVEIKNGEGLILVVDDEEVMRQTARSILEECGYDVLLAEDGQEGVTVFRENQQQIKAVVLDLVMPKLSGKQAYVELIKIDENVKVLLASGFKQDERVQSVLDLGVRGFIQKPYDMVKLANTIHDIIYG